VSDRIRVLFVINGLGTGGAERSLAELLPALPAFGIEPTVAVLRRRAEGVEREVRRLLPDVRLIAGARMPGRVRSLREILRTSEFDLVHTTLFESDIVGRLAAAGLGVPVLSSLVNDSYHEIRLRDPNVRRWRLDLVRLCDAWTARHLATHFHAISQATKASAVRHLGIAPDLVTVIERGRDTSRLGAPSQERRAAARRHLGLPAHSEVVVSVGRHEFQKGQKYLIEAVDRLIPQRPGLVLMIAGRSGHMTPDLIRTVEASGAPHRIRLLGHRDDVPELLAAADVFAFPSLYEGLGCATLEAMALGLPIVASDIPALREILEPGCNALFVPPSSSEALAAAIGQLLDRTDTARAFGDRNRALFLERFTLHRSVERMAQLYTQLALRRSLRNSADVQSNGTKDGSRTGVPCG
jgi:glycosyltransferase involved in cell wall biosynthesis